MELRQEAERRGVSESEVIRQWLEAGHRLHLKQEEQRIAKTLASYALSSLAILTVALVLA